MFHAFSWVLREALERQERNDTWKQETETLATDQRQADDQVDTLTLQLQGGARDITPAGKRVGRESVTGAAGANLEAQPRL